MKQVERACTRRWVLPVIVVMASLVAAATAQARSRARDERSSGAQLLVSGSRYREADIQPGVTVLPPGCTTGCATATADGAYPYVFNNDLADPSFGVAAPIFLERITPSGSMLDRFKVPTRELVTSFSSKSELALNLSTSGRDVTFMGYAAPIDGIDISNSNTPAVVDPTNPVSSSYFRAVAALDPSGRLSFTETNAYSSNNGRAAILNDDRGHHLIYTAGNAGNGSKPQPDGVVLGAGAQIMSQSFLPESLQSPGAPTPVASFNVTQLGDPADKIGKDDKFRGLTIFDGVLYYTKGSGSNGVDTVYFVDTTGKACPNGTGVPQPGAQLPTQPLAVDPSQLQSNGLPSNMCVLKGFPTTLAKSKNNTSFPFGIWFANPHTLYLADEGNGSATFSAASGQYTDAAAQSTAGLQKWVFDTASQSWQRAYTLQAGLDLGQPYDVPGYPVGDNAATALPWAPATDGLRNITGRVNRDGSVTIWAVTSTVSGSCDQGADPNQLVSITDDPTATSPGSERFEPVITPRYGQVLRGVALAPHGELSRRR
ncbi:MAG: hypothetical protein ACXVVQ_04015 [Solirubrobacteraceae bacterium]